MDRSCDRRLRSSRRTERIAGEEILIYANSYATTAYGTADKYRYKMFFISRNRGYYSILCGVGRTITFDILVLLNDQSKAQIEDSRGGN